MSFLPQNTILGNLELIEVYEYYDKPLLFACKNASGQIFIAVLIEDTSDDDDKYYEQWMYVSVSRIRFEHIRSGAIDLHDAFVKSENGHVFFVDIEYCSPEDNITVKPVSNASLKDELLPVPGNYLQLIENK